MDQGKIVIANFLGGLAPSTFVGDPASQGDPGETGRERTRGFDPNLPGDVGILQQGFQLSSITNVSLFGGHVTHVKQVILNNTPYLFLLGDGYNDDNTPKNTIYKINLWTHTNISSSAFAPHGCAGMMSIGKGLELFGSYLWYASGRYLGRYDLSLTFNDSFNVSLSTAAFGGGTIDHPMVQGNGKLFIGNVDSNGNAIVTTVDAADVVTFAALDLTKTRQFIQALEFGDDVLYIGTSANNDNAVTYCVESYLYIWDTVSGSYQKRFRFPQGNITSMRQTPNGLFVFSRNAVYRFTGTGWEPIFQMFSGGPGVHSVDFDPYGFLWWKTGTSMYSYGPRTRQFRRSSIARTLQWDRTRVS